MREQIQYEDNDFFNPETAHEHSDVPVRPLFWLILTFIVFGVVSHVALFMLYKAFVKAERNRMDPPQTQVSRPADASVPKNQPLLQPFPREVVPYRQTPVTDLEDMRRAEEQVLENYSWVDKQNGVVRIPIDEAKKLYAARAAVTSPGAPASPERRVLAGWPGAVLGAAPRCAHASGRHARFAGHWLGNSCTRDHHRRPPMTRLLTLGGGTPPGQPAGRRRSTRRRRSTWALVTLVLLALPLFAQQQPPHVTIAQKLNTRIPLDLQFRDERGEVVRLEQYFNHGRPVLLN
jgi:hypothetical protein